MIGRIMVSSLNTKAPLTSNKSVFLFFFYGRILGNGLYSVYCIRNVFNAHIRTKFVGRNFFLHLRFVITISTNFHFHKKFTQNHIILVYIRSK